MSTSETPAPPAWRVDRPAPARRLERLAALRVPRPGMAAAIVLWPEAGPLTARRRERMLREALELTGRADVLEGAHPELITATGTRIVRETWVELRPFTLTAPNGAAVDRVDVITESASRDMLAADVLIGSVR